MKDILFMMTGGTIDAEAYADPARPPKQSIMLRDSLVSETVIALGYADDCRFFQWTMKDSKDFTVSELYAMAVFIKQRRAQHIIITHGTDRMPENSRILANELAETDKTIIMTGSMLPLANGVESDAPENLRYAIEHIESLPAGVHVVMHAQLFNPSRLIKNYDTFRFEETNI
ncbi:MAG: asparaginase domain-containing protein [Rickettsiales bacterium]